jgi:hypothetical protein
MIAARGNELTAQDFLKPPRHGLPWPTQTEPWFSNEPWEQACGRRLVLMVSPRTTNSGLDPSLSTTVSGAVSNPVWLGCRLVRSGLPRPMAEDILAILEADANGTQTSTEHVLQVVNTHIF